LYVGTEEEGGAGGTSPLAEVTYVTFVPDSCGATLNAASLAAVFAFGAAGVLELEALLPLFPQPVIIAIRPKAIINKKLFFILNSLSFS